MMPATSSTAMCLSRRDRIRMKPTDSSEPAKAARISARPETEPSFSRKKIIVSATVIFAPEEMPSTKGPAMGLLKKV